MKRMFLVVATIMAMTASMMAYGQTTMGDVPCGKWVAEREKAKARPNTDDEWAAIVHTANLAGFLSGLAIFSAATKGVDVLSGADSDSLIIWMDNYCRTNPLKSVYRNGGVDLFFELAKKKKR